MNAQLILSDDSIAGRDLARMEQLLSALRDAAVARGVAGQFVINDHRLSRGCKLSLFRTRAEAAYEFQAFYQGVGAPRRRAFDGSAALVVDHGTPGPQWVKLSSENRLAWVRHVPKLLQALAGLAVGVSPNHNWRWARPMDDSSGPSVYVPVYEALISLRSPAVVFNPEQAAQELVGAVCAVEHPLADHKLFDWQTARCGRVLFSSYRWTPEGFVATFHEKSSLVLAQEQLFAEFETTIHKEGRGTDSSWKVTVKLPHAPDASLAPFAPATPALSLAG